MAPPPFARQRNVLYSIMLGALLLVALLEVEPAGSRQVHLEACTQAEPLPKQESMPQKRQVERQRAFRRRERTAQPTLDELRQMESYFHPARYGPHEPAPVTAILNVWNRRTLCRQIDALRAQTVPPALIWVCVFGPSPLFEASEAVIASYNDSRLVLVRSTYNLKYYGRFQMAMSSPTKYFHVIDDDMIPGSRYIEALFHVSLLRPPHAHRRLLGSIGWLLPAPQTGLLFSSYRAVTNDSGGLYVPDLAYGIHVERLLEVDYLCSMWFGETRWLRQLFRERPLTFDTGEDFHLSHMLRKYLRIGSYVMPTSRGQPELSGDTDHRLAYARYSTGGAATIKRRDAIWWHALTSGSAFTWQSTAAPPHLRAPLDEAAVGLVVVDGETQARVMAPLYIALAKQSRRSSEHFTPLLVIANGRRHRRRANRDGTSESGGGMRADWLAECVAIVPFFNLQKDACSASRLRILALDMIHEQPPDAMAGLRAHSPAQDAAVGHVASPMSNTALVGWSAQRKVLAAVPLIASASPKAVSPTVTGTVRMARQQAAALKGLSEMVRSLRPRAFFWMADTLSAASRAANELLRLQALQNAAGASGSTTLVAKKVVQEEKRATKPSPMAHAALPASAPPWLARFLASLSATELHRLHAPRAITIAAMLIPAAESMDTLRVSFSGVHWLHPLPSLRLLLPAPFSADALSRAQQWAWDGDKQVVARVIEAKEVVDMALTAWMPDLDDSVSGACFWRVTCGSSRTFAMKLRVKHNSCPSSALLL